MSSKKRIVKVGIIGAGGIAKQHAWGYQKCPDAEMVAVCDTDKSRAEAFAKELNIPEVFTDYKEMLKKADIEATSVCLPNFLHGPVTVDALNAGKHVICEKPLAHSVKDGVKMVETAKKMKKTLMVGFHQRFRGETQVLKQFIDEGALGKVYYAKAAYLRRVGIPAWGQWFCLKDKSGGGPLIDIGVHALDLTLYLMGFPEPLSVSASTYAEIGPQGLGFWGTPCKFDVEDLGVGLVKFKNGATLLLETSWALNMQGDSESYIKLYGTDGGAILDPPTIFKNQKNILTDTKISFPKVEPYNLEIANFIESIQENKAPMATGEQGLVSLKILEAMYKSSTSKKEVFIK